MGVYSTEDGTCVDVSTVESVGAGGKPTTRSKLPVVWHWKHLHVVRTLHVSPPFHCLFHLTYQPPPHKAYLVLACGSSEATTSTIQPHELETSEKAEETRVVAFELVIERPEGEDDQDRDPDAVGLVRIGDWAVDGPVQGISLHSSADGEFDFFFLLFRLSEFRTKRNGVMQTALWGNDDDYYYYC